MTRRLAALLSLVSVPTFARAEPVAVPMAPERWEIAAEDGRFVDHLGRRALMLKGGTALAKGSRFTDGIIELDLAVTGERGFVGAFFRGQGPGEYEEFYIRPHQSGNPDANQYQPVFHDNAAWQLYYGDGYGAPVAYDRDRWMPIKIVVSGGQAEVYIKDLEKPALFIGELKREVQPGGVGLSAGNFAPGYFSNFRFEAKDHPALKGTAKPAAPAPPGTIMAWQVSDVVGEKSLDGQTQLASAAQRARRWTRLACERTGLANLARVAGVSEGKDTVFARVTLRSDRAQTKRLRFGFSDIVRVYLDGRLLYRGSDVYQSRDYRFLGTIGLFDELYLPLAKGRHELSMAVTERFGGWGVIAAFDDLDGIVLLDE